MVLFDLLPPTTRGPLAYVEIAPSTSGNVLALKPYRALVIGQRTTTGASVPALALTRVTSAAQAQGYFGAGSQLYLMLEAWFLNNKGTEVWAMPVADDGAAVARVYNVTVAGGGASAPAGAIVLYIGGRRIAVSVSAGEANNSMALKLRNAVNADPNMPFVAAGGGAVLQLTAKNLGAQANEIDVRDSYGANEALPTGLSLTYDTPAGTAGTGTVSYSSLGIMGLLGQVQFDVIVSGANDATNLAEITADLDDRWGPIRQIEGTVYTGFSGDLSATLAQGALLNSKFSATVPAKSSPSTSYLWAAATGAAVAFYGAQDPARPFHTIPLRGILAPKGTDRWTHDEREQLLQAGMATHVVAQDGTVQLHRLISNYQTSPGGAEDPTFLDMNTVLTLGFLRYSFRTLLVNKYPRHKLANDGTRFAEGQPIMTPERGRAEAVAWFGAMESLGLVEDVEQFKRDLVVERNAGDPNRLDFLLPTNLVNQLQVVGARLEFTL